MLSGILSVLWQTITLCPHLSTVSQASQVSPSSYLPGFRGDVHPHRAPWGSHMVTGPHWCLSTPQLMGSEPRFPCAGSVISVDHVLLRVSLWETQRPHTGTLCVWAWLYHEGGWAPVTGERWVGGQPETKWALMQCGENAGHWQPCAPTQQSLSAVYSTDLEPDLQTQMSLTTEVTQGTHVVFLSLSFFINKLEITEQASQSNRRAEHL